MAIGPRFFTQQAANFGRNLGWLGKMRVDAARLADVRPGDMLLMMVVDRQTGPFDHFLDHYLKMGVNRIVLVRTCANPAADRLAESRPDVVLFSPKGDDLPLDRLHEIRNAIMQRHFRGHWCLFADPGEYLLYPRMQTRNLRDLAEFLANERRVGLHAVALDAYPAGPLGDTALSAPGDPFALCPFIDRDFHFEEFAGEFTTIVRGGPVMRVLTPEDPRAMTVLNRIPMVSWRWSTRFTDGHGGMRPFKAMKTIDWKNAIMSAALIRFPFLPGQFGSEADFRASLAGRHGPAYLAAWDKGLKLHDEAISRPIGTVDSLIRAGLMSAGNWF